MLFTTSVKCSKLCVAFPLFCNVPVRIHLSLVILDLHPGRPPDLEQAKLWLLASFKVLACAYGRLHTCHRWWKRPTFAASYYICIRLSHCKFKNLVYVRCGMNLKKIPKPNHFEKPFLGTADLLMDPNILQIFLPHRTCTDLFLSILFLFSFFFSSNFHQHKVWRREFKSLLYKFKSIFRSHNNKRVLQ